MGLVRRGLDVPHSTQPEGEPVGLSPTREEDSASAEECSGTITADEALKAENARYAAQTANDFAAMEKLFGSDMTDNHSSAAGDSKASYIDPMRSGRVKCRKMTPDNDLKTRTCGCLALITGAAVYQVAAGDEERTVPLRFTAILAKRPSTSKTPWKRQ